MLQQDYGCLTCLQQPPGPDFLDVKGKKSDAVSEVLRKHFWFTEIDFHRAIICLTCWEQVSNFNRFYATVEDLYKNRILMPLPVDVKSELGEDDEVEYLEESLAEPASNKDAIKDEQHETDELKEEDEYDFVVQTEMLEEVMAKPSDEESEGGQSDEEYAEEEPEASDEDAEDEEEELPAKRKRQPRKRKSEGSPQPVAKRSKTGTKRPSKSEGQRQMEDDFIREHVKYICELCGQDSTTFTLFLRHSLELHDKKSAYVACCGKKYYKKVRLFQHVQTVNNPNAFRCEECQKNFTDNEGIKRHLREFHATEEERKFKCDRCPKSFVNEYKYKKHMQDHEDWENKSCKCEHCGKIYKSRHILANHIKLKHTEPTEFICDICAKGFHLKSWFLQHKLEHEDPSELKMQCQVCMRWLKNRESWRRHMQQHKETEATCDICGHVSPHQRALKGHKRRQHSENKPEFPCAYCPKTFSKPITMREHVAAVHTGDILYSCSFCEKTFNSHANMHSHKKKMHPEEWWLQHNNKYYSKHYDHLLQETDLYWAKICQPCWDQISDFHVFFVSVQTLHSECIAREASKPNQKQTTNQACPPKTNVTSAIIESVPNRCEGQQLPKRFSDNEDLHNYNKAIDEHSTNEIAVTAKTEPENDNDQLNCLPKPAGGFIRLDDELTATINEEINIEVPKVIKAEDHRLTDRQDTTEDSEYHQNEHVTTDELIRDEFSVIVKPELQIDDSDQPGASTEDDKLNFPDETLKRNGSNEEQFDGESESDQSDKKEVDGRKGKQNQTRNSKTAKQRSLDDAFIKTHVQYTCVQCGVDSETFALLRHHYKHVHNTKSCYIICCGRRYYDQARLCDHVRFVNNPDTFRCTLCQRNLSTKLSIDKHMEIFHTEGSVRCKRCHKSFANKHLREVHMQEHSELESMTKSYSCEYCGCGLKNQRLLDFHLKQWHDQSATHRCSVCSMCFTQQDAFLRHTQKHEDRDGLDVQCESCLRTLKNHEAWSNHVRFYHVKQGGVECDTCGLKFSDLTRLRTHIRRKHGKVRKVDPESS